MDAVKEKYPLILKRDLSPSENWYLERYLVDKSIGKRNIVPLAFRIKGIVPSHLIKKAIAILIERNEILCTEYEFENGKCHALVYPHEKYQENLSCFKKPIKYFQDGVKELIEEECMKGIDIFNLSPYQIILFEKEDRTEYSLVLNFHHIIFDWDSIHILHEQLLEIFQNITEPNSKLTPVGKYSDYVFSLSSNYGSEKIRKAKLYWQEELKCTPDFLFKKKESSPGINKEVGSIQGVYSFNLEGEEKLKILDISRKFRCMNFCTLMGVLGLSLADYTEKREFLVNSPFSNRFLMTPLPTFGVMLYSIIVRYREEWWGTVGAYMEALKKCINNAFDNQPINLNVLMGYINGSDVGRKEKSLQVFFNNQYHVPNKLSSDFNNQIEPIRLFENNDITKSILPFTLETYEMKNMIIVRISYHRDYFKVDDLIRFEKIYKKVLEFLYSVSPDQELAR